MKRELPFHSQVRGIGVADVYHTNDACPIARSIEEAYRLPGTGLNRPLCVFCSLLNEGYQRPGLSQASLRPLPEN
jgi:hypothetical protein